MPIFMVAVNEGQVPQAPCKCSLKLAALVYSVTSSGYTENCHEGPCQGKNNHAAVCHLQAVD